MEIVNLSPLKADRACFMDAHGAETLVVAVKGTWSFRDDRSMTLAEAQRPVLAAPVYRGDPAVSSLLYESDLVLGKPATDCALLGHAWAPRLGTREMVVTFSVGSLRKTVKISGARRWIQTLGLAASTPPEPFEAVPLSYENAFGGADLSPENPAQHEYCARNPVGKGFRAGKSRQPVEGTPLPSLEDPREPVTKPTSRPTPVGFGFVAPMWEPRVRYAGTYDAAWQENDFPLLPRDFDPRFFCAASEGLAAQGHLRGDEEVVVEGASKKGRLHFRLPGLVPRVQVRMDLHTVDLPLTLDSLIVEPDEGLVQLVWGGRLNVHERVYDVRWIRVSTEPPL